MCAVVGHADCVWNEECDIWGWAVEGRIVYLEVG